MSIGLRFLLFGPAILPALLGCEGTPALDPVERDLPSSESRARLPALETPEMRARFDEFNRADVVFTADDAGFEYRGSFLSLPEIIFGRLQFRRIRMLKGNVPSTRETNYSFQSPFRLKVKPQQGSRRVFGAQATSDKDKPLIVTVCIPENESTLALARAAVALPVGWSIDGGEPLCPWKSPAVSVPGLEGSCGRCGRAPLRAGAGINVASERIPLVPGRKSDVYSDGIFRVTVSNPGVEPVEIPALVCDDRGVRWPDSLVVVIQPASGEEIVRLLPPGDAPQGRVHPAVLAPGESSSVTIDLFLFDLDKHGGGTVAVQFALGDRTCRNSFYFNSGRR